MSLSVLFNEFLMITLEIWSSKLDVELTTLMALYVHVYILFILPIANTLFYLLRFKSILPLYTHTKKELVGALNESFNSINTNNIRNGHNKFTPQLGYMNHTVTGMTRRNTLN